MGDVIMQKNFFKFSISIIFILAVFIFLNHYENSKTYSSTETLSNTEKLAAIKNIINNSSDESLAIEADDIKIENIYTLNINDSNLIIFHDMNSEFHSTNFMVFEEKNKDLKLKLYENDILKFSVLDSSFFLLETKRMGRGTGVSGADYLMYNFDFNLAWVGESYLLESPDGVEVTKTLGFAKLDNDHLYYTTSQISLVDEQPIEFKEFRTEFEYRNNKFTEIK
jgi:hypothetical protein